MIVVGPDRQASLDMDFEGFADTLDVNVLGPLRVTQAFMPHLRRSDEAKILTVSSQMGMMNNQRSDRFVYRASKAAVNKVMQGLATDLHASAIAVLLVHPGWVRTEMGGQGADISPKRSAMGILDRAEELTMGQSGTFVSYDGSPMKW